MLAVLTEIRSVTQRDTLYTFKCPDIARTARPGQFVELKLTDGYEPFLRRPISIFDADGDQAFSLLVRTVGRGTAALTKWDVGAKVDVLGPLGNGFAWKPEDRDCVLVAGGIGLAPLSFLAKRLLSEGKQVRLVFSPQRDAELLKVLPFQEQLGIVFSENRNALPAVLTSVLRHGVDTVFSCGPEGLLGTVAEYAAEYHAPCQLSVERRMACGIGICLGCAIAIRAEQGIVYKKVCKDGPVFRAKEVVFGEKP